MKKSLLLSAGLLLSATAAFAADPIDTPAYLMGYSATEGFFTYGVYPATTIVDADAKTYTMPDFLGYGVDFKFKAGSYDEDLEAHYLEVLSDITENTDYETFTFNGAASQSGKFTGTEADYRIGALEVYATPYSLLYPAELPDYPEPQLYLNLATTLTTIATDGTETTGDLDYYYLVIDLPEIESAAIDNVAVDNTDANAPVKYYNLQGIEIAHPENGNIYIRRQGSKASKVAF